MKIAIVDTAYPDFLSSLPDPINGTYESELREYLDRGFGTFDAYSHYLKLEGHECIDIIANHERLQERWATENNAYVSPVAPPLPLQQIVKFEPDVVFCQDLSYFNQWDIRTLKQWGFLVAGQCSCPMPREERVSEFQILFTSFPHYVSRFEALGVQAHYLPLAFDPRMLSEASTRRTLDIVFIGGVGKHSHWKAGTETLEAVADAFKERFHWFGYGRENLESGSPLIPCYGGPAWGRAMYDCYGRAKIVVNRHGEVAAGYSNNLRMYEATGMGAMLITEGSKNLDELFPRDAVADYRGTNDLIGFLKLFLNDEDRRREIAAKGQAHTLANHTYAHRMKTVSEVLTKALDAVHA